MGRILSIDYGTKRAGIAVTDPMQIIATALDTIHPNDLIAFLKKYNEKEGIESFVIGMPKTLQNEDSSNAQHVRGFIRKLKKEFPDKDVHEVDERFTSTMAQNVLLNSGINRKERQNKSNTDKISACIILQSYLESKKRF